jgi:hypothetical protein
MNGSLERVQPLVRQLADWIATLDSRPREKQLAIATGVVAALFAWFGIALASPLLLAAVPLLGGLLYGGVRTQRRLHPAEGPIEVSLDRAVAAPALPAAPPDLAEPEDEPGESLLSRISLAPPPPPVGRSSASYVYEPPVATAPEPEPEPRYEQEPEAPQELAERFYEVCESVDGDTVVRHASPSLFGATDYALELHVRSRGEIEVVRVRGAARENVLRFTRDRPPEGSANAKSLLDLFGYPVTRWTGPSQSR